MITVKEAMKRTGKAQFTINSLCQKHLDSQFVKKEKNIYLIDESFLFTQYPELNQSVIQSIENQQLINIDNQLIVISLKKKIRKLKLEKLKIEQESFICVEKSKNNESLIIQLTAINNQLNEELKQKNKEINELHYMLQTMQVQKAIMSKSDSFWSSVKNLFVEKSKL